MRRFKRVGILLLAVIMVLSLACGCGVQEDEEGLTLSIAMVGEPETLDPVQVETMSEITLVNQLYENLMKVTPTGVTYGNAKNYTYEESGDGSYVYTFHLRNDAYWSDGTVVMAKDYVNAWKRLVNPETDSPYASLLSMVEGYEEAREGNIDALAVKAISKNALRVTLTSPCPYFINAICTHFATVPIRTDHLETEDWDLHPALTICNGPYRLQKLEDGEATLIAFSNYHDDHLVQTSKLSFIFASSEDASDGYYQNGTVDIALQCSYNDAVSVGHTQKLTYAVINQDVEGIPNEEIRKAMISILNRNTLSKFIGSNCVMATGFVGDYISTSQETNFREANGDIYTNEAMANEDYTALCKDANVVFYNNGYASKDAMETLNTTIICTENSGEQTAAQYISSAWKNHLGISIQVKVFSEDDFETELVNDNYTLAILQMKPLYDDATAYLSSCLSSDEENYSHYYSNAYDLLLRAAENSSSKEARDAYLEDAEIFAIEDGAVIPLYEEIYYYEVRDTLTGFFQDGLGNFHFYGTYVNKDIAG